MQSHDSDGYSGLLSRLKKEGGLDTGSSVDESWRYCAERNTPVTKGQILQQALMGGPQPNLQTQEGDGGAGAGGGEGE